MSLAVDAHVAQLAIGVAGKLGVHGAELAVLGPNAQGMVEQVHGFGLQVDRRRQHSVLQGPGGGQRPPCAAIPSPIGPAFDPGRSS